MMDKIEGKVWTFPDSIDTDVIIPGRYLRAQTMDELAAHVMEPVDPSFAGKIRQGDIIVAGWNFGCGSSREQAPLALKHAGIAAVVAKSFARIFYRNAINIGLPVIVADMDVSNGDEICIDLENGNITDKSTGKTFKVQPFKKFMLEILEDGGLTHHYLKKQE